MQSLLYLWSNMVSAMAAPLVHLFFLMFSEGRFPRSLASMKCCLERVRYSRQDHDVAVPPDPWWMWSKSRMHLDCVCPTTYLMTLKLLPEGHHVVWLAKSNKGWQRHRLGASRREFVRVDVRVLGMISNKHRPLQRARVRCWRK